MTTGSEKREEVCQAASQIASREGWLSQPELIAGRSGTLSGFRTPAIASREGWLSQPELIAGGAEPSQGSAFQ